MANKKPIVTNFGRQEELRSTDTLSVENAVVQTTLTLPDASDVAGPGNIQIDSATQTLEVDLGAGLVPIGNTVYTLGADGAAEVTQTNVKVAMYTSSSADFSVNYNTGAGLDVDISALTITTILGLTASVRVNNTIDTPFFGVTVTPVVDGSTITLRVFVTYEDEDEVLIFEIDPTGTYDVDAYTRYKTGTIIDSIDLSVTYV